MATAFLVIGMILCGFGIGFFVKTMCDDIKEYQQKVMLTALKNGIITTDEYIAFMEKKEKGD